jgi:uncharacterized protein
MEYRSGSVGRVFSIRFDEGDDFLGGLTDLVRKEEVRCAWFHVLGGLRQAEVVTGPREPVMPPEPVWASLAGARETLGSGSIYWDDEEPRIHLHAALGHHGETITACVRKGTKVYLVLEVLLIELLGLGGSRPWYGPGGFHRLTFA